MLNKQTCKYFLEMLKYMCKSSKNFFVLGKVSTQKCHNSTCVDVSKNDVYRGLTIKIPRDNLLQSLLEILNAGYFFQTYFKPKINSVERTLCSRQAVLSAVITRLNKHNDERYLFVS